MATLHVLLGFFIMPTLRTVMQPRKFDTIGAIKFLIQVLLNSCAMLATVYQLLFKGVGLSQLLPPAIILIFVVVKRRYEFRSYQHIPGPEPYFVMGNYDVLTSLGDDKRHEVIQGLHDQYGPIFRLHMPLFKRPVVYTNELTDTATWDALRPEKTMCPASMMCTPLNETHKQRSQTMGFHVKTKATYARIVDVVQEYYRKMNWEQNIDEFGTVHTDLKEDLECLSIDVILDFLLPGSALSEANSKKFREASDIFIVEIGLRTNLPPWLWINFGRLWNVAKALHTMRSICDDIIDKANPDSPLLHAFNKLALSKWEQTEELLFLLTAGYSSTAIAILSTTVMLGQNHETLGNLRRNLRDVLDRPLWDTNLTIENVRACTYFSDVFYEAQRLQPTVPFSCRKVPHRVTIHGFDIPAKTNLMQMKIAVGRNEKLFDSPNDFRPERFSGLGTRLKKLSSYRPFGSGTRRCWGEHLSETLVVIFLMKLVSKFEISEAHQNQALFPIAKTGFASEVLKDGERSISTPPAMETNSHSVHLTDDASLKNLRLTLRSTLEVKLLATGAC